MGTAARPTARELFPPGSSLRKISTVSPSSGPRRTVPMPATAGDGQIGRAEAKGVLRQALRVVRRAA